MRYLAAHGADIHARRKVGGDAYQQALYGKKLKHLPVIEALGHTVAMHGGEAFRSAVFNRNRQAVDFFRAWRGHQFRRPRPCSPIARRPCWWPPAIAT